MSAPAVPLPAPPFSATPSGVDFCAIVDTGDIAAVSAWLQEHPSFPLDSHNDRRLSPLTIAASNPGSIEIVRLLLTHGASVNFASPDLGTTPLHAAASADNGAATALLLAAGADPLRIDSFGRNALHCAAVGATEPLAARLLRAAVHRITVIALEANAAGTLANNAVPPPNALLNTMAFTSREVGATGRPLASVLRFSTGSSVGVGTTGSAPSLFGVPGASAFRAMAQPQQLSKDVLRSAILTCTQFFVNMQDSLGYTALMLAAEHGRADTVGLLLSAGADVKLRSRLAYMAADIAEWYGYTNIVKLISPTRVALKTAPDGGVAPSSSVSQSGANAASSVGGGSAAGNSGSGGGGAGEGGPAHHLRRGHDAPADTLGSAAASIGAAAESSSTVNSMPPPSMTMAQKLTTAAQTTSASAALPSAKASSSSSTSSRPTFTQTFVSSSVTIGAPAGGGAGSTGPPRAAPSNTSRTATVTAAQAALPGSASRQTAAMAASPRSSSSSVSYAAALTGINAKTPGAPTS